MDKRSYLSLLAGLGFSAALFSSVFALAFVAKLLTQGRLNTLYLLGFTAAAWTFWYVTLHALRAAVKLTEGSQGRHLLTLKPRPSLEGQIILLARSAKGRLSAAEVAAATHLSVDESREVLKELITQGVAEMWVNDEGGLVYVFPELFEGFKESAKSPLAD